MYKNKTVRLMILGACLITQNLLATDILDQENNNNYTSTSSDDSDSYTKYDLEYSDSEDSKPINLYDQSDFYQNHHKAVTTPTELKIFEDLPPEIITHILSFVSKIDIPTMLTLSGHIRNMINSDNLLWFNYFKRSQYLDYDLPYENNVDYKKAFTRSSEDSFTLLKQFCNNDIDPYSIKISGNGKILVGYSQNSDDPMMKNIFVYNLATQNSKEYNLGLQYESIDWLTIDFTGKKIVGYIDTGSASARRFALTINNNLVLESKIIADNREDGLITRHPHPTATFINEIEKEIKRDLKFVKEHKFDNFKKNLHFDWHSKLVMPKNMTTMIIAESIYNYVTFGHASLIQPDGQRHHRYFIYINPWVLKYR